MPLIIFQITTPTFTMIMMTIGQNTVVKATPPENISINAIMIASMIDTNGNRCETKALFACDLTSLLSVTKYATIGNKNGAKNTLK